MSSASDPKPVVTGYPAAAAPHPAAYPTAYPAPPPHTAAYYPAPHPNGAAPPPAPYGAPSRLNTIFLRRLLAISIAFFLLIALVVLILWLVLRSRLPAFAVSSASVSSFNLSATQQLLSADFDLTLSVRNPNHKMGIYYDNLVAAVLYGTDTISETNLPPFYQGKGDVTTVRGRLVAAAEYVDAGVAKGIAADRGRGDGTVNFYVRVVAWVRFRSGAWRTRRHVMRVYCDHVPIGFNSGTATVGTLLAPPKTCLVNL